MAAQRPIIIKKKKAAGHGGHHGGAWKVAYADFVTAMMAFFLVMWIMGLSDSVKKGISGYFKEPGVFSFTTGKALPIDLGLTQAAARATSNRGGVGEGGKGKEGAKAVAVARIEVAKAAMTKAASDLKKELDRMAKGDSRLASLSDAVSFEMTPEGLRIELAESRELAFFEVGGSNASAVTSKVLSLLAPELKRLGADLDIEGHTDRRPYDSHGYTNWELSADRANAARKILLANGLPDQQIRAVTGFADRKLRKPDEPFDVANRRVSIIVRYAPDEESVEVQTLGGHGSTADAAPADPAPRRAAEPAAAQEGERTSAPEPRERAVGHRAPGAQPSAEGVGLPERQGTTERGRPGEVRQPPPPNPIGPVISPEELQGAYRRGERARHR